ncbi:hypothetical protein NMY22_g9988 [Coprinellus aureogranulatus]|nr:hypothetical protein NMY22_g9988 [Coprinellus aureogranulatus]
MRRNSRANGTRLGGPVRGSNAMEVARVMAGQSSHQIADYLCKNMGLDEVSGILKNLDATLIPSTGTGHNNLTARSRVNSATYSLSDILVILGGFGETPRLALSGSLQSFMDDCWKIVVEQWGEITLWISYLVSHPEQCSVYGQENGVLRLCVQLLMTVISNEYAGHYKDEVISATSTARLIIHILCLSDPHTGKVSTARQDAWTRERKW